MKFKLIIDKTREETVVATVHERSRLTDEMELLVLQHDGSDQVAAYTEDGMRMLPFSDIECITVLDGKTYAVACSGERLRLKLRLYELEELLSPSRFARISNGEIVNLKAVTALDLSLTGTIQMTLTGGVVTYVSRRYVKKIKQTLNLERRRMG